MARKQASPTKKSPGKVTTKESPGGSPKGDQTRSRSQRTDTPEAKLQQQRMPKTHPGQSPVSVRKDKTR
ncbi:MAG TPA: hypothetical protein VHP11_12780 [Tepidisphaeraceae bacterium]|jgi:hypothetical protein|nr:hypothetical protein [Tepidisphaeraceae bacterium]